MDIEHLEAFALADDRTEAKKQLIPGTEEYSFYLSLDHSNAGRLDRARELLKPWIERHGRTARVMEIEHRLALFSLGSDPRTSSEYIAREIGARFDHQREIEGRVTDHPEKLDQKLIARAKL